MDLIILIKVIFAIVITVIILSVGIRVLSINRANLLNRWFFLFCTFSSIGFLLYTIYHLITFNSSIVIPIMVTAQILFNFTVVALLMTVFILDKFSKVAMSPRYFVPIIVLLFLMSFGYFIWTPTLNMDSYAMGIVDTITPSGWLIFVNLLRMLISIYVVFKYITMSRKAEKNTKKRVQWFSMGVIIIIVGLFLNVIGGFLGSSIFEIIAIILFAVGGLGIFRGFLI